MYIDNLFETSKATLMLDMQYRMSNQIGKMISKLFYGGHLKNGREEDSSEPLSWISYIPTKQWPEIQEERREKPRIFNEDECNIIADLIKKFQTSNSRMTIGIITPYKAQAIILRKKIRQSDALKIDTVDGFQGKECDVIIFSVTRTWGSYRFLADPRRLNVALSRAKDKIIIVGDIEYAKGSKLLSKIIKYCTIKDLSVSNPDHGNSL
jgi:superfamily I DNA and/or RNA helicase